MLHNTGVFVLFDGEITEPFDSHAAVAITRLSGMTALGLEFEFKGGNGGSKCFPIVQTSMDQGKTWRDIARADFINDPDVKHCNLEGLLSKAVTKFKPLTEEGVNDGILGDQLRVILNVVGIYKDTWLSVRASVR